MEQQKEFDFDRNFEQMMERNGLNTVLILGHRNPDGDAAGSVMGLAHYIHKNYPQYRVIPHLADTLDKGPKKQVLEDRLFRPMEEPEPEGVRYGVIVCDTATRERIIGRQYLEGAAASIVVDHHASNEGYGDVNFTKISEACAENIFGILDEGKLRRAAQEPHPNAADYIYMGILHDTSGLKRAGASTLYAASCLLDMGVEHRYVMRTMLTETLQDLQKRGEILNHVQRSKDGKVAWFCVSQEEAEKMGIGYEDIHPISSFLRDCEDIELGFTMFEEEPGIQRCSFRSDGRWLNVDLLVRNFGGGGHAGAAGLRCRTEDPEGLRRQILEKIAEMRTDQ